MAALPTTGVKLVDLELQRHGPFSNPEAAEILAARLLNVWRVLRPDSARSTEGGNIGDENG